MADKKSERKTQAPEHGMRAATKLSGDRMVNESNKLPRDTEIEIDNTKEEGNVKVRNRGRNDQE